MPIPSTADPEGLLEVETNTTKTQRHEETPRIVPIFEFASKSPYLMLGDTL
jgi:hypothetical protein